MILKIYTVYDAGVKAYMPPFTMRHSGEATRAFRESVNDPKSNLAKYPSDFTLFEIGSYDDSSAKIDVLSTPVSLGVAVEFLDSAPPLSAG